MTKANKLSPANPTVRCAIYTRKSTEEGLEKEFNSLDAQRESAEAYIKSQAQEGWQCIPGHYDDGGFTGGNMERPALKRLLADIEAGKIDCVIVYKVGRLSRSLLDFARMMETFDKQQVAFVSVTQAFNTTSSMGRLVLNVLLSFAQFEREIISERTRDKIAAARRKGKWAGGHPILGYDIDPQRFKLIVNENEAVQVSMIFNLYLELGGLIAVVEEIDRRGWFNKRWTTRKGRERGGKPFTKTSLHKLLTNITYIGKIRYKAEIHDGEHAGIIDPAVWQQVQARLQRNGRTGGALVRNKFGALLKGILCCVPCKCAMTPTHTTKDGNKRYRYYVCSGAQKRGWHTCPSKSIPAAEIERFVVEQIKCIGKDPNLLHETLAEARALGSARVVELETERRGLDQEMGRLNAEVRKLSNQAVLSNTNTPVVSRLADLQDRIRAGERRTTEINEQIIALGQGLVNEREVTLALSVFDPVWDALTPREQARIVQLLVERVDYDGAAGNVSITLHPSGIKALASDLANAPKEKIA
ncbi:MAG: recombinase family protein [Gemmataceae bacterium]